MKFSLALQKINLVSKHTGCSNAINSVHKTVENYVNGGSTVNLCAIDLSKSFDKVNHYALFYKIIESKHTCPVTRDNNEPVF